MTSRYCYCPMTQARVGRRVTILDRIRKRIAFARQPKPDVFPICGYNQAIYPRK